MADGAKLSAASKSSRRWFAAACAGLWAVYAILAWCAVSNENATFDEPNHAIVGWFMLHRGDFRLRQDRHPGDFANYFYDRSPDAVLGGTIYLYRFNKSMFPAH
ncbi:MAG TPA: hypothetical protein VMD30_00920 [Tepidisphaeraceae bacterium]|nr:hypothetical protein [Tepidisphaeraceae bacterium]